MDFTPIIFFVVILLLLLAGFPVAFTLGGASIMFGIVVFGFDFFNLLPLRVWGIMSNYILIAVPLFIFMGVMFEKSGISEELLETTALLFGKVRGGFGYAVLLVGVLMGASTGIVGATVVTMGVLSLPVMLKRGCDPDAATGIIAASGTLGQIIPPSIVLVLLGSVLNVPIGDLFIGAVIPGFILVFFYFLWILYLSIFRKKAFPAMPVIEVAQFREKGKLKKILSTFLLPLLLVIAVLGTIFLGIASPTEAAAIGAIGATMLTILRKKFSIKILREVSQKTTWMTSMAFMILVGASAFGLVFRGLHGDIYLKQLIMSANLDAHHFLMVVMIIIFIAGFFIDFIEIIFIIVPIVAPIFLHYQIDLLWVGILIALNLQTSFLTPPFGFSLFYLKGVSPPEITSGNLYRGIIPYVIIQILVLVIIAFNPGLVTYLVVALRGL
jgi:tripartite ATP-independent transporter DctM subunit